MSWTESERRIAAKRATNITRFAAEVKKSAVKMPGVSDVARAQMLRLADQLFREAEQMCGGGGSGTTS